MTVAVTRADVARRAGVSPAVVSYVLNPGSRPVSAAARARIEQAILETGYRPNAIAQALRRSSTMSIGLMVPDLNNPATASLVRAIEDIAYDAGYVLFIGTVGHDLEREKRYLRTYADRQVDAVIMLGVNMGHLAEIAAKGLPVLILDTIPHGLGVSSVVAESHESAATAVRHLIEIHGHSRVACVTGSASVSTLLEERVDGWRSALESAGLPCDDGLIARNDDRDGGYFAAKELLASVQPTAFFVTTDMQAVGVIRAVREANLYVPGDIAVMSFDGSELAARAFPGLSSVDPGIQTIAETAMKRVLARLDKSNLDETHDILPSALVLRRSCGCNDPAAAAADVLVAQ